MSGNNDHPVTLSYSNLQDEQLWVEGQLATWQQRFDAAVIDGIVLWVPVMAIVYGVMVLTRSELLTGAAVLAWMSTLVVPDVVLGWSPGRANGGLMIRGADGTFPRRRQLLARGVMQRLWYVPTLVQFGLFFLDQGLGVPVPDELVGLVAIVIVVCGMMWFVNGVMTRSEGTTLADRLSDTRMVAQ